MLINYKKIFKGTLTLGIIGNELMDIGMGDIK